MRQDSAALTLKKSYEGEPGKAGATKDHQTNLLSLVIVRNRDPTTRSFDFTATNKARQTREHAGEEPTTATDATTPTSLNITIVVTEASTQTPCRPLVPLVDVQLQRPSPQEGIRHQGAVIVRSQGSRVFPGAARQTRSV
jgi:hypothetical protein